MSPRARSRSVGSRDSACAFSGNCPPMFARGTSPAHRFIFYCYGAHRDLHSFPTRRSSDLLAFDDFGTGYASLSYLARFPLTRIKIDQSFVRKIGSKPTREDTAIIRSIIIMAHNLGLEVIAEGVETAAQAGFLEAERCEEAQGFLYSKPLPIAEFERFVTSRAARLDAAPTRTGSAG